jgi:hypothetical protein
VDDVAFQRVGNPVRILCAEAVEYRRVIEHDNIGCDRDASAGT